MDKTECIHSHSALCLYSEESDGISDRLYIACIGLHDNAAA